ncbi:CopG family transcriptional regulator [Burkholderia sp. AU27893]|nr:CopG family transcriptional regulator [Burkholderia contaminans]OXI51555.1 CopG family transcriptional regulator [Burkholderia sp. AU27893]MBA9842122.1 CopG family transcriptional regulator [Burkholderia contaminans]MBA9867055.1 CopG family transcriptional regulator [Burkholderia contaminans]MBA9909770.1 CopG family transcriptional regulator [Burkholderia contaminans]
MMFDAHQESPMRTTIDIDDDILALARARAKPGTSIGKVISELARAALQRTTTNQTSRNGLPLMPTSATARSVTLDTVNQLRDDSL